MIVAHWSVAGKVRLQGSFLVGHEMKRELVIIDQFSFSTCHLTLMFGDTELSTATGFLWLHRNRPYLVTNWHNLSGRNAVTGKCLDEKFGGVPDRIKIKINLANSRPLQGISLLNNSNGNPIWLEHPEFGNSVDVACLPLSGLILRPNMALNTFPLMRLSFTISTEVFILGYPLNLSVANTPIWKRASVASEPAIDIDGLPKFYVDTASQKGMSGSPVIFRVQPGGMAPQPGGDFTMHTGPVTEFVGIYSGRVSTVSPLDAQLGIIWKPRVIEEIMIGKRRARASIS